MTRRTIQTLLALALAAATSHAQAQRSTPVTVVNTPTVEIANEVDVTPPPIRPVHLSHFQQFDPVTADLRHRFAIPADTTLQVEQISIACSPRTPLGALVVGRTTVPGRRYAGLRLSFVDTGLQRFRDRIFATEAVTYYVFGGDELEVSISADDPGDGVCTIGLIGRNVDATP